MFKNQIKKELKKTLTEIGIIPKTNFDVSRPQEKRFGDYSSNIAMILAGQLHRPPFEIAQEIVNKLGKMDFINRVSIERPAFINFYLGDQALIKNLLEYASGKGLDNSVESVKKPEKIILEHTNVNPNKAIHIGHLRSACLGDAVKKILQKTGRLVEVEYYVDNTGLQVAITLLGFKYLDRLNIEKKKEEKFDHFAGRVYVAMAQKIKQDSNLAREIESLLKDLEDYDSPKNLGHREVVGQIVNANLETTGRFTISYDALIWESDIFHFGLWEETLEKLKTLSAFYLAKKGKNKGCWVLVNSEDQEKVIIKSNGIVTYTGKDIAYHFWKYGLLKSDFKYKKWETGSQKEALLSTSVSGKANSKMGQGTGVLNFIDMRQSFPQESVKSALQTAGFQKEADNFKHIGYGLVSLSPATAKKLGLEIKEKKSSYALSGRDGLIVNADDLLELLKKEIQKKHPHAQEIEKIAVGAIKYYLLKPNPFGEIVFDYNQALDLHGNSGPYLQYAHARAANILKKIDSRGTTGRKKDDHEEKGGNDWKEEERNLIRFIVHYREALIIAGRQCSPNLLAGYLFELASLFSAFYSRHSVANCHDQTTAELRKNLVLAVKNILKDGLSLLGIEAPDKI